VDTDIVLPYRKKKRRKRGWEVGFGGARWAKKRLGQRRKRLPTDIIFFIFFIFDFQNLHRNKRWRGGRILETFSKLDFQSFQSLISIRIGREEYR
jgi:hypothetical protein